MLPRKVSPLNVFLITTLLLSNNFSFGPAQAQAWQTTAFSQAPTLDVAPGVVLVGLNPGANLTPGAPTQARPDGEAATQLEATFAALGVTAVEPLFAEPGGSAAPRGSAAPSGTYRLRLPPGADIAAAVDALRANADVSYAEPDYLARAAAIPNDPLYATQWALPHIGAPAAWDVVTGTATTVIALVDSGLDLTHPDLAGQLWTNPGEIPGNGLDDDNNGYVDDVHGWNFVAGTNNLADDNGHGTLVAGVIGAAANNATGTAGVCWGCRLMVLKVMQGGVANYSDIAAAVRYAADKGASVINLSLGGYADSATLRAALTYAAGKGAVIVGGAGNDAVSTPFYPAAYPEALAVAATTQADARFASSNFGDWVDLAAPGEAITTTFLGGTWGPSSGTSLAAGFVSGVAGLVRSQHPEWTAALVRAQLLHTTDALAAAGLGSGRLNAGRAVTLAPHPLLAVAATAINGDPLGRPTPGDSVTLTVSLSNDWLDAANVTGTLTTDDSFVTLGNSAATFGSIAAGSRGSNNRVYSFTVASGAGYNHRLPFSLAISANGGAYTTTLPLTLATSSGIQNVSGTILTDTTWTSDTTYVVDKNNVGVPPGVTLTIQAGTQIKFNDGYSLNVGGTLLADGTSAQPIRFMSNTGGAWGRLFFDDSSLDARTDLTGTYQAGNLLRWVRVEGAASGIGCNNATPFLDHVTLTGGGMTCAGGDTSLWIRDSDLSGNIGITELSSVDSHLLNSTFRNGNLDLPAYAEVLTSTLTGNLTAYGSSLVFNTVAGGSISLGSGAIENSTARGGLSLNSGTAQNNIVTGGITTASGSVLTNTVRQAGITAGNGSTVQGNTVEDAPGWGVQATGGVTVTGNRLVGNLSGLLVSGAGLVQGNLVANNTGEGLEISGNFTVVSNTFTGNGGHALVVSSGTPVIQGNNLEFNTGTFDLVNNTANPLTAAANWWGTTDPAVIDTRIYDYLDQYNLGRVSYTPALTGPVQTAPAYVRHVTVQPDTTLGIQTGTFDVDFSRPMNTDLSARLSIQRTAGFTWAARAPMPTARYGLGVAAAPNGKLYAIGGWNGRYLSTVEEYDPATNTWATRASLPTACYGLGVAAAPNGKLYAIGGLTPGGMLATVDEYDPAADTWTPRASLPAARYQLGVAAAANGKLYAVGGWAADGPIEEYDPATDTWATRANMLTPRFGLGVAAAANGKLYAVGGYSNNLGAFPSAVEEYDPATDTWTVRTYASTTSVYLGVAAAPNGKVYVLGGEKGSDVLAAVKEINVPIDRGSFYGGEWLSPTRYRAYNDFTALVPRDTYSVVVSGAASPDGLVIAPNSSYTLTVDYAGAVADTTPPAAPAVWACGSSSLTTLSARWLTSGSPSAINLYQYAIGVTPSGVEVVNWTTTTVTSTLRTNLNLLAGQTYYVSAQARNAGGLWSPVGVSSGVVAGAGGCPTAAFSAIPTAGPAPLNVRFTDASTGTVSSRLWTFGDGTTSTLTSPTHTYAAGVYTVTLQVGGPGGSDLLTRASYIGVQWRVYLPLARR